MQRQREAPRSEPTQVLYPVNTEPMVPMAALAAAASKNHFAGMKGRRLGGEDPVLKLVKLVGDIGNQADLQLRAACLAILSIVCDNIVRNPGEPKFRSLKKTSVPFQSIAKCPGGVELLEALGFKDSRDGMFVLPESGSIPKEVVDLVVTLNAAAKSEISSLAAAEESLKTAAAAAAAAEEAERARKANANRNANLKRAASEALLLEQQQAERIAKQKEQEAAAAEAELNRIKAESQKRAEEAMQRAQRAQEMLAAARAEETRKREEAAQQAAVAAAADAKALEEAKARVLAEKQAIADAATAAAANKLRRNAAAAIAAEEAEANRLRAIREAAEATAREEQRARDAEAAAAAAVVKAAEDKRIAAERWAAAAGFAGAAWWGAGKVAGGAWWLTGSAAECAGSGLVSMASWCSKRATRKNPPMCVAPAGGDGPYAGAVANECTCEALKGDGSVCGCRATRLSNGKCSCGREAHIKQLSGDVQPVEQHIRQRRGANIQLLAEAGVTQAGHKVGNVFRGLETTHAAENNGGVASRLRKKGGRRFTYKK